MAGRLAGKVAIVTGAAPRGEGIGNGSAIAILFAREGAKVALVNRSMERAEGLKKTIEAEGGECMACAADVSKTKDVQRMVDSVVERYGKLDVLVNNVGMGLGGTAETVSEDAWDKTFERNLKTALLCSKYSIPQMKKQGGGSIINISTFAAIKGIRREGGLVAYTASKAGLHGMSLAMAADFAADRIRSNVIVVGSVWTPLSAAIQKNHGPEFRTERLKAIPLGIEGTGWDVGWAAVYLASDESRWVTGASIPVEGGVLSIMQG